MTLSGFINRRAVIATTLAVSAALLAVLLIVRGGPPGAVAADHLDAPGLAPPGGDRRLDINDLYAFKSRPGYTTLIMTVNPLAEAGKQERFARSVPGIRKNKRASYHFKIDNDGDSLREVDFKVTFGAPNRNGVQRMTLRRNGRVISVGRTSKFGETRIVKGRKDTKVFAGMADDPFFFDLPGFQNLTAPLDADPSNDADSFLGCMGVRPDTFAGSNVSVIAIEVKDELLMGTGRKLAGADTMIGVWATTNLARRQIDRIGRPAINTVFLPHNPLEAPATEPSQKNRYNRGKPVNDQKRFRDEVVDTLETLFSLNDMGGPLGGADDPTDDADGIAGLADSLLPDILTIDPSQDSGFPNGRRLQDDVIDGELDLITESQFDTDCVDANDLAFFGKFPYVADPHA